MAAPVPITILTGYLGSGKTTLLNRLLRDPNYADSAIIVNEFGEIGIDHLIVASAKENILLMEAGCLCCVMVESLRETLADLYHRRATGAVPRFARIVIETTGLADPAPILRTLTRDAVVAPLFRVEGVICAVDAVNAGWQLDEHVEARDQFAMADRSIVTKADRAEPGAVDALTARLRAMNPLADLAIAPTEGSVAGLFAVERDHVRVIPDTPGRHAGDIVSEAFHHAPPVTMAGLAAWTGHLVARYGDDLLRCKALLKVRGRPGHAVVQGVRQLFDIRHDPALALPGEDGRIMCIGRNLDRADLVRGLSWLDAPEGIPVLPSGAFAPWAAVTEAS